MNAAAELEEHHVCDCGEPIAPDVDACDSCLTCDDCTPTSQCRACADDLAYSTLKDER